jgi:carbon storage regulator
MSARLASIGARGSRRLEPEAPRIWDLNLVCSVFGLHGGPTEGGPVLVLTRRANQSIMIGHEIVVTVLEVRGDQVRLGIKAPRSIDVHREEIFAQLQQANRDAVRSTAEGLESLDDLPRGAQDREGTPRK